MVPTKCHLNQFRDFDGKCVELLHKKGFLQNSLDLKPDSRCQAHDICEIAFIDEDLMDAANIIQGEKIQVVNNNNGERLETYVISGPRNSGEITLNGAAAHKVNIGDVLILITYAIMSIDAAKAFTPALVFPDETTNLLK